MIIAFEGIDGTGKSTQVRLLAEALEARGRAVLVVSDPKDSGFGWAVQRLAGRKDISPTAAAMFFVAAKFHIYERLIQPAMKSSIIICDRWIASTVAYQGYGYGRGEEVERIISSTLPADAWPDLTILLDAEPEFAYSRCDDSDRSWIDRVGFDYMHRVRSGFHSFSQYDMSTSLYQVSERSDPVTIHQSIIETVLSFV